MRYKSDWEEAKKRHIAFWQGEVLDRCCVSVRSGDKELNPLLDQFWQRNNQDVHKVRTTPDLLIEQNRIIMEHTYYGGDALPLASVDLGASGHAGFFKGANYQIGDTVWFFPSLTDPAELIFDPDSYLFTKTLDTARALAADSCGDYFVSMPDSTGNADALAHLMGSENLLMAMLEDPESVTNALGKIQDAYQCIMTQVYDIVKDVNQGGSCVGWLNTWAPGFHAQMQCDLSVMISGSLFKEFIMPELQAQCSLLDYPLYHFDGSEQLRHLDDLLSLPNLKTIQWTQVVGQPPCTDFIPQLKKIQAAGKNLHIAVSAQQIRPLMENLSSRGLYLTTWANSREEADAIIKDVSRMTHD